MGVSKRPREEGNYVGDTVEGPGGPRLVNCRK